MAVKPEGRVYVWGRFFILYVHSSFQEDFDSFTDIILQVLKRNTRLLYTGSEYFIALLWSDGDVKNCVDLFHISGLEGWGSNPEYHANVFKNGVPEGCICGEGMSVVGREEEYRRIQCGSLEEYLDRSKGRGPELPEYLLTK
ncbi:MAG: hypothetical protein AAB632_02315 [Patescibacteria group bacterium]